MNTEKKCSFCTNNAIIHRKHSGQFLCKGCFIESIEKIISKTISKYKMLNPKDNITVAVSGGKDSMALLYNLMKIQAETYQANPLKVISINEGVGDYRDAGIDIVRRFCADHDLEHHIISFQSKIGMTLDQICKKQKKSSNYMNACNYCATIRRRLLNEAAKEFNSSVLAMGHNLTDYAETFLMNILHKRLKLIANQYPFKDNKTRTNTIFIKKIFPLMRTPEEEIQLYVKLIDLDYHELLCPYRKKEPLLRKRVLHFILDCRRFSPEIEFNLFNGFTELSEVLYSKYEKCEKETYCENCGYPSGEFGLCSFCSLIKNLRD